jgi:starch phosphorylase
MKVEIEKENAPPLEADSALLVGREDRRTGLSVDALKRAMLDKLVYVQARFPQVATRRDCFMALAQAVRDRLLQRWVQTARTYRDRGSRTVCYLSAEFLIGPQLGNNLINLGIFDQARQATQEFGLDLEMLLDQEEEPGLGNGGLGRLAACYLDSLATLEIPAIGYGILYEFGIFTQAIRDGQQIELTDKWLRAGSPWLIHRPSIAFDIKLGGHTEFQFEANGERRLRVQWVPAKGRARYRLGHAGVGLRGEYAEPAPAVERRGAGEFRFRSLQCRQLLSGRRRPDSLGDHHQGAVSER